jgi:hypothetical protein
MLLWIRGREENQMQSDVILGQVPYDVLNTTMEAVIELSSGKAL